jgi:two-component system, OmpR family, phosphate regulon sensor histidine kinase PhoR
MPKRRLWWHVLPFYGLLALLTTLGAGWLTVDRFEHSWLDATRQDLTARADFLEPLVTSDDPQTQQQLAALCRRFSQASGTRVSVLLPSGQLDAESLDSGETLEDPLARKEIGQAQSGTAGDDVRYNAGLDQPVFYMAIPIFRNDQLFRILYFSTPLTALERARWQLQTGLAAVGVVALALAVALARLSARSITTPLEGVYRVLRAITDSQWSVRAVAPDPLELAELAENVNRTADRMHQRIAVLIQNNNEQKAVLASMAEGVLAVDNQQRVISLNTAAIQSLAIDPAQTPGRPLREVVRNADLSRFITRALACQEPIESDILLHGDRERTMQARGSALHDLEGRPIGVVVVLNDVTAFRRLEHIRRDFVANVSHELKTPITSIKGFVETLLDGAMHDPTDSQRFLQIVAKQADRLHAIIEDLLALSKIEQAEDIDIVLERRAIRPVIDSAVNTCQTVAHERSIDVVVDCPERIQGNINAVLLEQAVVNLLDNAIKYSDPGREVHLTAIESDGQLTIQVADRGSGIASQHLERIFERFYRVDRARSRKLGGTGLGLAIVKHIVQAHHGRVEVESTLGVGSTFTMVLPRP